MGPVFDSRLMQSFDFSNMENHHFVIFYIEQYGAKENSLYFVAKLEREQFNGSRYVLQFRMPYCLTHNATHLKSSCLSVCLWIFFFVVFFDSGLLR